MASGPKGTSRELTYEGDEGAARWPLRTLDNQRDTRGGTARRVVSESPPISRQQSVPPTVDDVVRELSFLSFVDATTLFDERGDLRPIADWPVSARHAVASLEVVLRNAGDGRTDRVLRVRFHPKSPALELLARSLGMLIERREIGGPGAFSDLSDTDLAARIHAAAAKLAECTAPPAIEARASLPDNGDSGDGVRALPSTDGAVGHPPFRSR